MGNCYRDKTPKSKLNNLDVSSRAVLHMRERKRKNDERTYERLPNDGNVITSRRHAEVLSNTNEGNPDNLDITHVPNEIDTSPLGAEVEMELTDSSNENGHEEAAEENKKEVTSDTQKIFPGLELANSNEVLEEDQQVVASLGEMKS